MGDFGFKAETVYQGQVSCVNSVNLPVFVKSGSVKAMFLPYLVWEVCVSGRCFAVL